MPFQDFNQKPFDETHILQIPNNIIGVYGIFNLVKCVYVGRATDIRDRLLQHCLGSSDQSGCIRINSPIYFVCDEVSIWRYEKVETELINELNPICNRT